MPSTGRSAPERSPIEALVTALAEAGADVTAEELADVLWLAGHLPAAEVSPPEDDPVEPVTPADSTPPEPTESTPEPTEPTREEAPDEPPAPRDAGEDARAGAALPLEIPPAPALPNALDLGRALRPMRRHVPSRVHRVVDEEATAVAIAETGLVQVVEAPAPEPWLGISLLVDRSPSMAFWQDTATELHRLLQLHGAFRDIRLWTMDTSDDVLALRPDGRRDAPPTHPDVLADPSRRRVVAVLSDCTGPAWRDGRVLDLLERWGATDPVVILQVLPPRLWPGTALGSAVPVALRAAEPASPNRDLLVKRIVHSLSRRPPSGTPVSVVALERADLARWVRLMTTREGRTPRGYVLQRRATRPAAGARPDGPTAEERVARFRAVASDRARRLADGLAAAAPLSLPVMRIVASALLPDHTIADLAEVLLSGLLYEDGGDEDTPADERCYAFHDGVQAALLADAPRTWTLLVAERLFDATARRQGSPVRFRALLRDPDAFGEQDLGALGPELPEATARVLRGLGPDLGRLADRLVGAASGDERTGTEEATETVSWEGALIIDLGSRGAGENADTADATRRVASWVGSPDEVAVPVKRILTLSAPISEEIVPAIRQLMADDSEPAGGLLFIFTVGDHIGFDHRKLKLPSGVKRAGFDRALWVMLDTTGGKPTQRRLPRPPDQSMVVEWSLAHQESLSEAVNTLINGLRGAAATPDYDITADSLANFLQYRRQDFVESQWRAPMPLTFTVEGAPMTIRTGVGSILRQLEVSIDALLGGEIIVQDGIGSEVARAPVTDSWLLKFDVPPDVYTVRHTTGVEALVTVGDALGATNEARLSLPLESRMIRRRWALVLGAGRLAADARNLGQRLTTLGYGCTIVADDRTRPVPKDIQRAARDITSKAGPDDLFWVHTSGWDRASVLDKVLDILTGQRGAALLVTSETEGVASVQTSPHPWSTFGGDFVRVSCHVPIASGARSTTAGRGVLVRAALEALDVRDEHGLSIGELVEALGRAAQDNRTAAQYDVAGFGRLHGRIVPRVDGLIVEHMSTREGTSVLVRTVGQPADSAVLFDGGRFGGYQRTLRPRLKELAPLHLDSVVLSHAHYDSMGGILELLQNLADGSKFENKLSLEQLLWTFDPRVDERNSGTAQRQRLVDVLEELVSRRGFSVRRAERGYSQRFDSGIHMKILHPENLDFFDGDDRMENERSVVASFHLGERRVLLTGDAPGQRLAHIAGHFDVLQLPHSGSVRDNPPEFLERVTADHYLVSCRGMYRLPSPETFEILHEVRRGQPYTIHLAQRFEDMKAKRYAEPLRSLLASQRGVTVRTPAKGDYSTMVVLGVKEP